MISDILSEAVHEIKRYRQALPDCYSKDECKRILDLCVATMESTRQYLDAPPQVHTEATKEQSL